MKSDTCPAEGACRSIPAARSMPARSPPCTTGNKPPRGCPRKWNSRSSGRPGRHTARAICRTPGCSGGSAKLFTSPAAFHGSVPVWTTPEKGIRPSALSSSVWFPGPRQFDPAGRHGFRYLAPRPVRHPQWRSSVSVQQERVRAAPGGTGRRPGEDFSPRQGRSPGLRPPCGERPLRLRYVAFRKIAGASGWRTAGRTAVTVVSGGAQTEASSRRE